MPVFYDIQKDRSFLGIKRNEDIYIESAYPALTSLISQGSRDERTSLLKVEDKPELQILVSYCDAKEALEMYRKRWQVETLFKGLKSSGFDIISVNHTKRNLVITL